MSRPFHGHPDARWGEEATCPVPSVRTLEAVAHVGRAQMRYLAGFGGRGANEISLAASDLWVVRQLAQLARMVNPVRSELLRIAWTEAKKIQHRTYSH